MIEGRRFVIEDADRAVALYVDERAASDPKVLAWLEALEAEVWILSRRAFASVSTLTTPDGFLSLVERRVVEVGEYQGRLALAPAGVQDPGNLGAMIRAAAAFFPRPLLLAAPGAVDPFSPKVVRASAGFLRKVEVAEVPVLEDGLSNLRGQGFLLLGLEMSGESVWDLSGIDRACLVVGSEGSGLSAEIRSVIDREVRIPQQRQVESLNAAAAVSVALAVLSWKTGLLA